MQIINTMIIEEVRNLYDARPFRPFLIHLADGRAIPVMHPEFLAFSPNEITLIAYQPDGSHSVIDLDLVTDLEVKANGRAAKRKKR